MHINQSREQYKTISAGNYKLFSVFDTNHRERDLISAKSAELKIVLERENRE